jgi:hypothetical protein
MRVYIHGLGSLELLYEENVSLPAQLQAATQAPEPSSPAGDRSSESSDPFALRAQIAVRLSA